MARKSDSQKANEAFEYYYGLGRDRSLMKVAQKFNVEFLQINEWSDVYAWPEMIRKRDEEARYQHDFDFQQQTLEIRSKLTQQISMLIKSLESSSLGLPFEIHGAADLRSVAQAYEALVRANVAITTKTPSSSENASPTSWVDLLNQSKVDSNIVDDDHENY